MNQFVRLEVRDLRTMEKCQSAVADMATLRKAKEDSNYRQNQDATSISRGTQKSEFQLSSEVCATQDTLAGIHS
jgi:hypothetical protein